MGCKLDDHDNNLLANAWSPKLSTLVQASLLAALQQRNRVRPALMTVEAKMLQDSAGAPGASTSGAAEGGDEAAEHMVLELSLWRADMVVACVEADKDLAVTRTDPAAGLLFGVNANSLLKQDVRRWGV